NAGIPQANFAELLGIFATGRVELAYGTGGILISAVAIVQAEEPLAIVDGQRVGASCASLPVGGVGNNSGAASCGNCFGRVVEAATQIARRNVDHKVVGCSDFYFQFDTIIGRISRVAYAGRRERKWNSWREDIFRSGELQRFVFSMEIGQVHTQQ